ncbi:MAG: AEC family transporter [Silicimonas sp.]|nr:AEC family transporter [Silicimonas sp.]
MQALLDVIIPVFLVIGAGYLTVWKDYISEATVDALMKFTQGVAIPCLLFSALSKLDLSTGFRFDLLFSFYIGATLCFALGIAGARLIFKRSWPDAIAIGFCCLFSNSVLLGLPITERAYGPEALAGNYAILAMHAPFCYLLGITTMEIARSTGKGVIATLRKVVSAMFHNALIIGIALGLIVNLSGLPLPGAITEAIDLIARSALPTALFALGGILVRYRPEGDLKTIAMVVVIVLVVHPVISYSSGRALGLDQNAMRSVVLTAAMAPGMNAYIFANMYGAAKRVAASSVLIATTVSVATVWLWLLILS